MENLKSEMHVGYPFPAHDNDLTPAEWGMVGLGAQALFAVMFFVYVAYLAIKKRKV